MIKKIVAGTVLVGAALAMAAPAASASPAAEYYAGIYPNAAAAENACDLGVSERRWDHCWYRKDPSYAPQVELWVD